VHEVTDEPTRQPAEQSQPAGEETSTRQPEAKRSKGIVVLPGYIRKHGRACEPANETSERTRERPCQPTERTSERASERTSERASERMSEWMREPTNKTNEENERIKRTNKTNE
jgi:hypothetical protein